MAVKEDNVISLHDARAGQYPRGGRPTQPSGPPTREDIAEAIALTKGGKDTGLRIERLVRGSDPLTKNESDALESHEGTIERGLQGFVEVGEALLAINAGFLYRATHDTFEDYCAERWGLSRKRAYDLTAASQVAATLSPIGDTLPRNEAVARELATLRNQPTELRDTWRQAVEEHGPTPTAAQVREVREKRAAPAAERSTQRGTLRYTTLTNPGQVAKLVDRLVEDRSLAEYTLQLLDEKLHGDSPVGKASPLVATTTRANVARKCEGLLRKALNHGVAEEEAAAFLTKARALIEPNGLIVQLSIGGRRSSDGR